MKTIFNFLKSVLAKFRQKTQPQRSKGCKIVKIPKFGRAKYGPSPQKALRREGVVFLGKVKGESGLRWAKLPPGWSKLKTGEKCFVILDHKGRSRAFFFRDEANPKMILNLCPRFMIETKKSEEGEVILLIKEGGREIIFKKIFPPGSTHVSGIAYRWLDQKYPLWRDPLHQWD